MRVETKRVQKSAIGRSVRPLPGLMFAAMCAFGTLTCQAAAPPDAKAVLKSMSDYVSAQQSIDFTFDSDIEVVTTENEKLQFTNSGEVQLTRPDKFYAHRIGGYSDVSLFFDGKTASIYGKNINAYATVKAVGTIDQLVTALREGQGVAMPGADLLLTNSYATLVADVTEAKLIGRGVVEGVECHHLAFRNPDTDWQLWVEAGAQPIPRKLVISSKLISGSPQYTVRVTSWKTGQTHPANTFVFTPTPGLKKVTPKELTGLDELPEGAPSGASP